MSAYDVVVVGGGAAGLFAAAELRRAGASCVVLEAGPGPTSQPPRGATRFAAWSEPLLAVDAKAWAYRASGLPHEWMRVRALGGRTLLWGGWCIRPTAQSLRDARAYDAPWPIGWEELEQRMRRVERRLRVRTGRLPPSAKAVRERLGLEVLGKRGAVTNDGLRPATGLDWRAGLEVRTGCVVTRLLTDAKGLACGVELEDLVRRRNEVLTARAVLLCASTIETTRLLLQLPRSSPVHDNGQLGENLLDHLVASWLVLTPRPHRGDAAGPLSAAAFVPRFVNLGRTRRRDYRSGFSLELRGPMSLADLPPRALTLLGVTPEQARQQTCVMVHAIGEVGPSPARRVRLHRQRRDAHGRALPVIELAWGDEEANMGRDMEETGLAIADTLAPPGSRIIPIRGATQLGGMAHESSTCRMGRDPRTSVVNPYGAVWGIPNLYVGDAAAMPTGLDRHPTLALLALTSRTVDRLVEVARNGRS